ncbi:MAG: beta strand repeat-containing protein, partial [Planctomyces sp.]
GNGSGGVMVDGGAADVVVGVAGSGNVISGNNLYGIRISGAQRTQVAGNLVGSRPDGKTWLGNSGAGVHLTGDVTGTVVGGSVSGSGNVVSGNTYGMHLDQTTGSVRISANRVGTTADGLAGLGNANFGIFAYRSQSIVIGTNGDGTGDDLEGNQISGNGSGVGFGDGVVIDGNDNTAYAAVDSSVIAGNRIGTAADGMSGLWNRSTGVALRRGVSGVRIGTDGNGVSDVAERNVIAGNEYYGVVVDGAGTFGNVIAGNYIGVTADSESRLLNWIAGLWIGNGAHHNRVGTDNSADSFNASERNLFGGHDALLRISGGNDNVIAGNYFGVNGAGTKQFFSVQGVVISDGSKRNLLGTDGLGGNNDRERNLIGGEAFGRVVVTGAGTEDNVIAGNWIGMGPDGVTSVGYSPQGILINGGAKGTRIGTDGNGLNDVDERNVVNGNGLGIGISGVGTSGTVVAGNYIGTDVSGSQRMQNTYAMEITGGASDTRIGTDGSNDAFNVNERNIISGGGFGLRMDGVTNVTIAGNYIGLNAAGTGGIRHYEYAIRAMNHVSGLRVGTNGDGIADAAEGNVIAGGNAVGLQIFNWINMDLGIADSFIAGTIPVTTATGSFTQADLIDGTSPLAGDWTYNNLVPGRGGDYFAFRATGSLAVTAAGEYTLAMRMDRGGRLKIDGVTVATDWGGNGLTLATVNLTAGSHAVEWVGFEETGAGGFELSLAVGGGKSGPITTANGWKVLGDAAPHAEIRLDGNLSVTSYYAAAIDSKTVIAGNLIGLLPDGVTRSPNDAYGLYVNADGVRIGGSLPAERNVISGNNGHGLIFDGWGLNGVGNSVSGNYIGVGTDGTTVVANGGLGVYAAASGLLI